MPPAKQKNKIIRELIYQKKRDKLNRRENIAIKAGASGPHGVNRIKVENYRMHRNRIGKLQTILKQDRIGFKG